MNDIELDSMTAKERQLLRSTLRDRVEAYDDLKGLARAFDRRAKSTVSNGRRQQLQRQAAQIRLVASMVWSGHYEVDLGRAWYDAGRLTLRKAFQ